MSKVVATKQFEAAPRGTVRTYYPGSSLPDEIASWALKNGLAEVVGDVPTVAGQEPESQTSGLKKRK